MFFSHPKNRNREKQITFTCQSQQYCLLPYLWVLAPLQFSSVAQLCPTLQLHGLQHTRLPCLSPSPKVCPSLFTESVMPTPISPSLTLFFCLQSFPASGSFPVRQLFCIRWPKDWSFSFSISPSNEYSGLISFKMDWFDLLAVQGTLRSLLQLHSSKASVFSAQLSLWSNSRIHT